jgi:hypothetical protein
MFFHMTEKVCLLYNYRSQLLIKTKFSRIVGGRHGCDRMVVRFRTTYTISAYHHYCWQLESRS